MKLLVSRAVDLVDDDDHPDADASPLRDCWAMTWACMIRRMYVYSQTVGRKFNKLKERCEAQHNIYAVI